MLQALCRIIGRTETNSSECRGVSRRHRSDPQQRLDGVQRWDQLEAAFLTAAGLISHPLSASALVCVITLHLCTPEVA